MTNFTKNLTVAAAVLLMAGVASAETLKADIPFAFRVGDKLMQAGTYQVDMNTNSGIEIFRLANLDLKDAALAMASTKHDADKAWRADGKPRLAFECSASRCALHEIWNGAGSQTSYTFSHRKNRDEDVRVAIVVAQPLRGE